MKRIILALIFILFADTMFAGEVSSNTITLKYDEPRYQRINIRYDGADITSNAEYDVDLESGSSGYFEFFWDGNIGPNKTEGYNASVFLMVEGFTHTVTGEVTPVTVSVDAYGQLHEEENKEKGKKDISYLVYGSDGKLAGTTIASTVDIPSLFFLPESYTKGNFPIGRMKLGWDRRNWPAGTYTCPVTIYVTAM